MDPEELERQRVQEEAARLAGDLSAVDGLRAPNPFEAMNAADSAEEFEPEAPPAPAPGAPPPATPPAPAGGTPPPAARAAQLEALRTLPAQPQATPTQQFPRLPPREARFLARDRQQHPVQPNSAAPDMEEAIAANRAVTEPQAALVQRPATIPGRPSTGPDGRPDGRGTIYEAGSMPLPERAQNIEDQLQADPENRVGIARQTAVEAMRNSPGFSRRPNESDAAARRAAVEAVVRATRQPDAMGNPPIARGSVQIQPDQYALAAAQRSAGAQQAPGAPTPVPPSTPVAPGAPSPSPAASPQMRAPARGMIDPQRVTPFTNAPADTRALAGMLQPGNVDVHNRPRVRNPDGSVSTVRSMSYGTDAGERLVPTISDDGRTMGEREAMDYSQQTGRHLGVFRTPEDATRYAERLHERQAEEYGAREPASAPTPARGASKGPGTPAKAPVSGARDSLDYGLPTDDAIRRARVEDEVLNRISGAFGALAGHAPGAHRRNRAQELMQQRQQGMHERMGLKQQDRQEARQAQTDELAARRLEVSEARDRRRDELNEDWHRSQLEDRQRAREEARPLQEARIQNIQATTGVAQERMAGMQALREQGQATDSPLARARRHIIADRIQTLRGTGNEALATELAQRYTPQALEEMNADALGEVIRNGLPRTTPRDSRSRTGRSGGGGGGGGGSRPSAAGEATAAAGEVRIRRLLESGQIDDSTAQEFREGLASGNRQARSETLAAISSLEPRGRGARGGGEGGAGTDDDGHPMTELINGVRVRADIAALGSMPAQRDAVEGLSAGRQAYTALQTIRDVTQRYGASAVVSQAARADLSTAINRMITYVGRMRNSGIIQPGELPTIEAFIPNPQSGRQVTFGTVEQTVTAFLRDVEDELEGNLQAWGSDEESVRNAFAYLRGGTAARAARESGRSASSREQAHPEASASPSAQHQPLRTAVVRNQQGQTRQVTSAMVPEGSTWDALLESFRSRGYTVEGGR